MGIAQFLNVECSTSLPGMRMNASIVFAPKLGATKKKMMYLSVEEGHYYTGVWVADRQWNGDETYFGLILCPTSTMLVVKSSLTKPHRG